MVIFIKVKIIVLKNIFGLDIQHIFQMIFRKKRTNFLFLLINRIFLLIVKWRMDPKSGGDK